MKNVFVLGSTGSIGVNTLNVIREFGDKFRLAGITANANIELLEKQAREFNPGLVVVKNREKAVILEKRLSDTDCLVLGGEDSLLSAARENDYDIFVSSLVGFAGLAPTIEAIKRKKRIALANKETLVAAGELVKSLCLEYGSELLPIDSEHSAIFQCLTGESEKDIFKIILTASGGPFRTRSKEEFENITVEEALNHPNWKMGRKITIDSATMMNKGLEVIEARWLFGLNGERIEVIIHPQSIIHSMVEFVDGSIKAQMSIPDMKLPIQYALSYPERLSSNFVETNLTKIHQLSFYEPDYDKFECLKLAYDSMEAGGTAPCLLNAANEIAVNKFLTGKIKFTQIPELIKSCLDKIEISHSPNVETIFECDRQTREFAESIYN